MQLYNKSTINNRAKNLTLKQLKSRESFFHYKNSCLPVVKGDFSLHVDCRFRITSMQPHFSSKLTKSKSMRGCNANAKRACKSFIDIPGESTTVSKTPSDIHLNKITSNEW